MDTDVAQPGARRAAGAPVIDVAVIALCSLLAALPAQAAAAPAHALVADPPGDTPYSFDEQADLTAVDVMWTDQLVVQATYTAAPPTADLHILVSDAARDEFDPDVQECDETMAASFTVDADGAGATFSDPYIEGELTAPPVWNGTTVTYTFSSPTLVRKFNVNGERSVRLPGRASAEGPLLRGLRRQDAQAHRPGRG